MTKVITRYFDTPEQAEAVKQSLLRDGVPSKFLRVFSGADGMKDALVTNNVAPATAEAYAARATNGGAVALVVAGYTPLGVAQLARDTMAQMGAADLGALVEEAKVKDTSLAGSSLIEGNPRLLTRAFDPNKTNFYQADWPIPLISKRKPSDEFAFPRHARMADWPIPLTASHLKPRDEFAFPRHARMANWIFPLTIRRAPSDRFVFPRHARMADWPLPLTNRRKPYSGALIARHARMANWPFPHLINGEIHKNSLMPGAPRMANFPFPLTDDRKPYTGSIFARHARMANFPIRLISRRKPMTASIFSRHARMANFILPLTIKHGEGSGATRSGFSFSRMFGLKTISKR